MNEQMIELARRAVACKGWRWMPGMLIRNADGPVRIDGVDTDGTPGLHRRERYTNNVYIAEVRCGPLPDPADPATLGCLLALVREAWGEPSLSIACRGWFDGVPCDWFVTGTLGPDAYVRAGSGGSATSEAEALVAALEAAP